MTPLLASLGIDPVRLPSSIGTIGLILVIVALSFIPIDVEHLRHRRSKSVLLRGSGESDS